MCLARSYLAAAPGLVKEAESGLQLPSACQGSQGEQKDTARETCTCVSLDDGENALFSFTHSQYPERSLPAERPLPSQASPDEEGFNPLMHLPLSTPADVSLNKNSAES